MVKGDYFAADICINRTFMELKQSITAAANSRAKRINRTFMELKLVGDRGRELAALVLIEPLWN